MEGNSVEVVGEGGGGFGRGRSRGDGGGGIVDGRGSGSDILRLESYRSKRSRLDHMDMEDY